MNDPRPDRIELGSGEVPDVLRTLAGVLPQFEGADLEGQLQTFDAFLGILSPSARLDVVKLLRDAAPKARTAASRARIEAAAESIAQGDRAAAPYDHTAAMQAYQQSFRQDNPEPAAEPEEADDSDVGAPFRATIKRRAIVMEIGGFRPTENPQASWFGKVTLGLPGEAWPVTEDGVPLSPLAQINLTELPFRPPYLDDIEFLCVFVDPDTLDEDAANGSSWCLRAYPSLIALVPLQAPTDLASEIKAFPMCPKIIEEDYPSYDDIADEIPEDMADSYNEDFANVSGFKLGGWPTLIQSEISWPTHAARAKPEYVFQIDSTEKGRWSWGDGGVGYFGRGTTPGHTNTWFLTSQCF